MKDWKNQIKSSDPNSFEIGNIWNSSDQLHEIIEDMCSLISKIEFDGMYFRKDIGKKAIIATNI